MYIFILLRYRVKKLFAIQGMREKENEKKSEKKLWEKSV
jgi:hypothetical protein